MVGPSSSYKEREAVGLQMEIRELIRRAEKLVELTSSDF